MRSYKGIAKAWLGEFLADSPDLAEELDILLTRVGTKSIQPVANCTCQYDGAVCETCDESRDVMLARAGGAF